MVEIEGEGDLQCWLAVVFLSDIEKVGMLVKEVSWLELQLFISQSKWQFVLENKCGR